MIRLEWLHATASLERWLEEEALLVEESRRVAVTFEHEADVWNRRSADWESHGLTTGRSAYASSQFGVYKSLAEDATYTYTKIKNSRPCKINGLIPVPPLKFPERRPCADIPVAEVTGSLPIIMTVD